MIERKKQIEEMARDVCIARHICNVDSCRKCHQHEKCLYQDIAYALYNAGYRKQSEGEWIKDKNRRTCSECGFMYFDNGSSFDFCPKCGAIMKGGEGNDTERVL